jgi:rod shape determining protein RodA
MMRDNRLHKNIDIPLLILTYGLAFFGVLIIYSVTHGDATPYHKRQLVWIVLGTAGLIAATLVDYHLYARFDRYIYGFNLVSLAIVLKFAHGINGAARWINIAGFKFQPSEFAKLCVILTLAIFLARHHDTIREPKTFLLSLLHIAVPMVLIFKQPDLGTALVLLAIWFGMVFMAGAKVKHLAVLVLTGVLLFATLWHTGKIIKGYQRQRLVTWYESLSDPDANKGGAGYHVSQARVAIGSGQMWGKGLLHGSLVRGGYVPEKQTDFIFSDIGEELGFGGTLILAILYGGLLLRGVQVIRAADEDILGKLIASGVVSMLAFHVVENIGMNIGIMPVAGVPLPFISAGGSNMLTLMTCIGLLQSITRNRHQLLF